MNFHSSRPCSQLLQRGSEQVDLESRVPFFPWSVYMGEAGALLPEGSILWDGVSVTTGPVCLLSPPARSCRLV